MRATKLRRRWTPAEEKQLQDMLDAGMKVAEAGKKLKRTPLSIYAVLQRIYRKRGLKAKGK